MQHHLVTFASSFCRWSFGKFFEQTRQEVGVTYFDIEDVTVAARNLSLQNLKNDLLPVGNSETDSSICMDSVDYDDPEIFHEYTLQESFLYRDKSTFIQKIVSIAGHLVLKCGKSLHNAWDKEDITSDYLTELKQGIFHVPTLATVSFLYFFHLKAISSLTIIVKNHWCFYNINQYYHESVRLKQQW